MYNDVFKINETMLYVMYAYVMMYVYEMLSGYARVWENKSLTVAGDLPKFCRKEMLENNSAGPDLGGEILHW